MKTCEYYSCFSFIYFNPFVCSYVKKSLYITLPQFWALSIENVMSSKKELTLSMKKYNCVILSYKLFSRISETHGKKFLLNYYNQTTFSITSRYFPALAGYILYNISREKYISKLSQISERDLVILT